MYKTYKDRVAFLFVYIREAHPSDEWQMESNEKEGVVFAQPQSLDERKTVATSCSKSLKLSMPVVVDEMDNRADNAYAGWPERFFVVDKDGEIAYAGQQGPWGFKPDEVRDWLDKNVGKGE
jgi:hypothetical protein